MAYPNATSLYANTTTASFTVDRHGRVQQPQQQASYDGYESASTVFASPHQ
jgi:hypothetical protein